MLDFINKYRINEYSDVLGLFVTIVGFAVTLWNINRSRKLTREAISLAELARRDMHKFDSIAELSAAIIAMEFLKNCARTNAFAVMPDRLSELRRRLAGIRSSSIELLTDEHKSVLQAAIAQFSVIERKLDRALEAGGVPVGWARDNSVLSQHIDKVHSLLVSLKSSPGDIQ